MVMTERRQLKWFTCPSEYVSCLLTFQQLFWVTVKLSDVLQAEKPGAVNYIETTIATLQSQRTETEWKNIWVEATSMANSTSKDKWPSPPPSLNDPHVLRDGTVYVIIQASSQ